MKHLLTYGTFPAVFIAAILGALMALEAGWGHNLILAGISLGGAITILILERVHPHVADWNRTQNDVMTDTKHLVVSMAAVPELLKIGVVLILYPLGVTLSNSLDTELWPSQWHILGQFALAMVISEFGAYWAHRLMHEHDLLWRLHATHHSVHRLYWLNAARFHPLDTALQYLGHVTPLALLGCPAETLLLFTLFTSIHGMFQHANIRMKLGPLNWIFSMAELHRWHHSTLVKEGNTNYGANLIIWDIVFGTRFLPDDRDPPESIGIGNMPNFPGGYWDQVVSPFRWDEVMEQSAPSKPID